jgi:hypothetical protein
MILAAPAMLARRLITLAAMVAAMLITYEPGIVEKNRIRTIS